MINSAENFALCLMLAICVYVAISLYVLKTEQEYLLEFKLPKKSNQRKIASCLPAFIYFIVFSFFTRERLPEESLLAIAALVAILDGIRRIDSFSLLIPDRLQVAGFISGCIFIGLQIHSGEVWKYQMREILFGELLVALLWILGLLYQRIRGRIGIGFGDIKLLAWIALFAGMSTVDVISFSIMVGIAQLIFKSIHVSIQKRSVDLPLTQDAFAFAPSIVFGFAIVFLLKFGT